MMEKHELRPITIGETHWNIPKVRQLILPGFMGDAKWVVLEW